MSNHDHTARPATACIHAAQSPEPVTGAIMPPIVTASTYVQRSPGEHTGFEYSRSHNPTRYALERCIARLEGSELTEADDASLGGFSFSSGLAAIGTTLELCDAGAHVIAADDLYGGTGRLFRQVRARSQGLHFDFVDLAGEAGPDRLASHMTGETALVWIETPTNPTLKLVDLPAVSARAKQINPSVLVCCDNTFGTPMAQRPLLQGADIVMHSSTKYLGGHSDVIGGILAVRDADLAHRVRFLQNAVGSVLGPFDSYLTLRGIKTLHLRMRAHTDNATRVATWLERHDQVERVIYPGLASHPHHATFQKNMDLAGGMVSFFLKGDLEAARRFLEAVELFALAESLGGVESLIEHPAIMTHASVPAEVRTELGIADNFIRLSVGVEDVDDLVTDLERGFAAAR
ncbi:MAG: PLP-dependent aspartate aminotransferase family protein [Planctomycetota bacterium]